MRKGRCSLFVSVVAENGDAFAGDLLFLGVGGDVHAERKLDVLGGRVDNLLGASSLHDAVHAGSGNREGHFN